METANIGERRLLGGHDIKVLHRLPAWRPSLTLTHLESRFSHLEKHKDGTTRKFSLSVSEELRQWRDSAEIVKCPAVPSIFLLSSYDFQEVPQLAGILSKLGDFSLFTTRVQGVTK